MLHPYFEDLTVLRSHKEHQCNAMLFVWQAAFNEILLKYCTSMSVAYLDEANVLGILPEALAADIQAVLANQAPLVGAHTAASKESKQSQHLAENAQEAKLPHSLN